MVAFFFTRNILDPYVLIHLGLGVLGLLAYLTTQGGTLVGSLRRRSTRYGLYSVSYSLLFLGILVLVNFLNTRYHYRWDLTEAKVFSPSPQTTKVLGQLQQDLLIYGFFERGENARVADLIRSYTYHSARIKFYVVDPDRNPELAKQFTAGILTHAREICVVTNQWINSYKRLVPGYEAPVYICWGRRNRSALVRVPEYKPGRPEATRIEARFPDPACNPYLAFAVMLAAGLRGVKGRYELPEPVEADVYEMSGLERKANKIETLPGSLIEALELAEASSLVRDVLGDHLFEQMLLNKRIEWDAYRTQVSDYEIRRYLPLL
jgi:hypothetical protein